MIHFAGLEGTPSLQKERNMVVTWKKLTPEQIERYRRQKRAYMEVYRTDNAGKVKQSKKRWADENKPYLRAKSRERYWRNREDLVTPIAIPPTQAAMRRKVIKAEKRDRQRQENIRAANLVSGRRTFIQSHPDRRALERLILDSVRAAIPGHLGRDLRDELTSMMFEAIYTGRFPINVEESHAREVMREHHRMISNFGPESLDEVVGENGITRGQALGIY